MQTRDTTSAARLAACCWAYLAGVSLKGAVTLIATSKYDVSSNNKVIVCGEDGSEVEKGGGGQSIR